MFKIIIIIIIITISRFRLKYSAMVIVASVVYDFTYP